MATEPLKIEGWEDLAKVLGIFKSVQTNHDVPSVSLEVDSKGNVKPSVKVFSDDPHQAMKICAGIFEELCVRFNVQRN